VTQLETCWTIADIFNGLMALPNLVALLCLSPLVLSETRAYLRQRGRQDRVIESGGLSGG
jgi:AGCS family alanine or glycine:cation symporter